MGRWDEDGTSIGTSERAAEIIIVHVALESALARAEARSKRVSE